MVFDEEFLNSLRSCPKKNWRTISGIRTSWSTRHWRISRLNATRSTGSMGPMKAQDFPVKKIALHLKVLASVIRTTRMYSYDRLWYKACPVRSNPVWVIGMPDFDPCRCLFDDTASLAKADKERYVWAEVNWNGIHCCLLDCQFMDPSPEFLDEHCLSNLLARGFSNER